MKFAKGLHILWRRLSQQGLPVSCLWAADYVVRLITGAPIRPVSQITPYLHIGGQYWNRGWPILANREITAVVNMRTTDDRQGHGIPPTNYLHLPTIDDEAPRLDQFQTGARFIQLQVDNGGSVYIHCKSGVGRAAAMAAAYFVSTGLTPDEAWAMIRKSRPFITPSKRQEEQVEAFASLIQD